MKHSWAVCGEWKLLDGIMGVPSPVLCWVYVWKYPPTKGFKVVDFIC